MTEDQIRDTFRYHAPTDRKVMVFEQIRERMTETAVEVAAKLPVSRERSMFLTLMQQAQMMANASVAIHGHPLGDASPSQPPFGIPDLGDLGVVRG